MSNYFEKTLGVVSPAYGAIKGEGMFGDLLGKKSENEAAAKIAADKAASDEAAAKKAQMAARFSGMKKGGKVSSSSKSTVSSASKRADGVATKGKTRGRMV